VILGGVFNSGLLADPRAAATYNYEPASAEILRRALDIEAVCADHGVPLRAAAIQFGFTTQPAVAATLVGVRDAEQARDCAAMAGVTVPETLWHDLRERGLLAA
jgi:D-threo-aldose 1-dehydrogenase